MIKSEWIFFKCVKKNGICVRKSGEASSGNLFASPLLHKIEISPTHRREFKSDTGQESCLVPTKSGDIII